MRTVRSRWCLVVSLCVLTPVLLYSAVGPAASDATTIRLAKLAKPQTTGGMSLAEALATRRSIREFAKTPVSPEHMAQLCWAAQGITDVEHGLRTAPSALKLYAIHIYVVDDTGAYEYLPQSHALQSLSVEQAAANIRKCFGSETLRAAPLFMIVAMEPERLKARCGDKAERFSLIEAGHVCQNVLLTATSLGLGAVPAGGIDEARVTEVLQLPKGVEPVYGVPVGHPAVVR